MTAVVANGERRPQSNEDAAQQSLLVIPARADFPLSRRISMGANKSVLVQFPFELRDVLVSSPDIVDAVVQSSNRVFLIGKRIGQANAFFFDAKGQQLLTLEINVGADLKGLDGLLMRYVPGSKIQVEMAGNAAVLSGTVRTPIDSKRAEDIACQMVAANGAVAASTGPAVPGFMRSTNVSGSANTGFAAQAQTQSQVAPTAATACGGATKLVINLLSIEGEEQVMLKVTVAEVQRTVLKQFGINVGALVNSGNFTTAVLAQNAVPLTSAAGLGSLAIPNIANGVLNATSLGSVPGFTNSGVSSIFNDGTTQIAGVLRAMERDGLIRTLAEPNLTAVSGETANFLAGGEYPIPVVDSDGKLSVTFKKFGVALAFTPIVLTEGRISLKIDSEVSELTNEGAVVLSNISIPALKKREAKSTVELPSGGSLAIAGLISESTRQNVDGFPGLKDVPVLGTLFRSRDFQKSETELVVIVTPYTVRPTARQNLARPDDGLAPATDRKANFLGHLNRIYGRAERCRPAT
ncbi:MAG: type II and III secretion system protein family protein [Hyphomicrobiaceae bacterium]